MKIFKAEPSQWYKFCSYQAGLIDSIFVNQRQQKPNFYQKMFDEDFSRLFKPMNSRSCNRFEIVANDEELIKKLLSNVKTSYRTHSIDETLCKLIEEIAQSIIFAGKAYYSLIDGIEQDCTRFAVVPFSSNGVVSLFNKHMQWVPNRKEVHWDSDDKDLSRELRILDSNKTMSFKMPVSLKRSLSAQNKTFVTLDKFKSRGTEFVLRVNQKGQTQDRDFNFNVWNDIQERALYRAAKVTGWKGRNYDRSKKSDFFDCHRLIRFRRNQLALRDSILNQLSIELSKVGRGYKDDFLVEILATDELSSIVGLNELELKLEREEIEFSEVVDYCYKG